MDYDGHLNPSLDRNIAAEIQIAEMGVNVCGWIKGPVLFTKPGEISEHD
jgi:hypothetical protein